MNLGLADLSLSSYLAETHLPAAANRDRRAQRASGAENVSAREGLDGAVAAKGETAAVGDATRTPATQQNERGSEERREKARASAEEFAGFFMGFLLKEMRKTVQTGELGHGGSAEKNFQELLDGEYGKTVASAQSYGLAESIFDSLWRAETAVNGRVHLSASDAADRKALEAYRIEEGLAAPRDNRDAARQLADFRARREAAGEVPPPVSAREFAAAYSLAE